VLIIKKRPGGFGALAGIQCQLKLIEDRPGTKTIPSKGGGWKADCQDQVTDSQATIEHFGPGEHARALQPEVRILTGF
jgi:hypothetical protein